MSEGNGKQLHVSNTLMAVKQAVTESDKNALTDMVSNLDGVRAFLLGGVRSDGVWPAGDLWISHDGHELELRISIRSLEVEARYSGNSWHGLLEQMDNDLLENTVRWKLDYNGRKRVESKLRSSLQS